MSEKTGIQRALEKFDGSASKLANAVGNGVLRQHVEHWLGAGRVSAEKTPDVAAVTGIPEEELNDRVNWQKVRQNKALKSSAPAQNPPADTSTGATSSQAADRPAVERRNPEAGPFAFPDLERRADEAERLAQNVAASGV